MKLNLGCGGRTMDGYENIDLPTDIRRLDYPPESCEEIVAIHVFEHLYRHEAIKALAHWTSLLQHGGRLVLEMPCFEKVVRFLGIKATAPYTIWPLYGNPAEVEKNTAMQHMWCWGKKELQTEMEKVGLAVTLEQCRFHKPDRDMRLVGVKP